MCARCTRKHAFTSVEANVVYFKNDMSGRKIENLICISSDFAMFQNWRLRMQNKSVENFARTRFARASVIVGRQIYLTPPSGLTRNFHRNFRWQRNIAPLYKLCESVGYVVRGRYAVSRTANFRVCSTIASSR